jgi:hypothetical protein
MFAVSIFLSVFSLTDHIYVSVCQTKQKQKTFWNLFVQRYITKILINIWKVNSDFSFVMKLLIIFTNENTCMSQSLNSWFMKSRNVTKTDTNRDKGDNNSPLIINICKWGIYIQNNSEIQSFQLFSIVWKKKFKTF